MRSLPLLLAVLIGITAIALTLAVTLKEPAGAKAETVGATGEPGGVDGSSATPQAAAPEVQPAKTQQPAVLPQGHVYAGITGEPNDVNPYTSHVAVARRFVLGLTHEGLLDTDPATGALRGAVAESWQLAEDGMSCTFRLRDGIRFSDGSPVTMSDVLFGWDLAEAGHLAFGFVGDAYGRVAHAEAVDDRTLRIEFRERYYAALRAVGESWLVGQRGFFLDRIAQICGRLGRPLPSVDSTEFAELLDQIDRECGPGTGPFQLPSGADGPKTWRRRQDLLLVRNPYHWRRDAMPGTWNLEGMRLMFLEGASRMNALVAGDLDWAGVPSAAKMLADRPELQEHYRKLAYDYETLGVMGIVWDCEKPQLQDVRVRRALAMLIDREAVAKGNPDRAVPAVAFAKPGTPEYPADLEPLPFSVRDARRLLRDAGFDPANDTPLRLTVLATHDGGPMDLCVSLFEDAARQAGVVLTVESLPFPAYVAKKMRGEWDGVLVNRSFRPWGDPYDLVHSQGLENDGKWQSEAADRLAAAARRELDDDKRAALWRELHAVVYEQQPFAFLIHPRACILFNKHIHNAKPGPRGLWPERWWVAKEHQRK